MKQEAASDGQKLDAQARQKEAQAQSMAAAWQSWAQRHRQARADALEQTKKRMEQLGYQNVEAQGL
jgi:L-lactate utilization protein LutB